MSDRLTEIEQRVNAATEGPWKEWCESCDGDGWYAGHDDDECRELGDCVCTGVQIECEACEGTGRQGRILSTADVTFIAHAREDVPFLLARVRELETMRDALREWKCPMCHGRRIETCGCDKQVCYDWCKSGQPCEKCGGDGLHPTASAALAASPLRDPRSHA